MNNAGINELTNEIILMSGSFDDDHRCVITFYDSKRLEWADCCIFFTTGEKRVRTYHDMVRGRIQTSFVTHSPIIFKLQIQMRYPSRSIHRPAHKHPLLDLDGVIIWEDTYNPDFIEYVARERL